MAGGEDLVLLTEKRIQDGDGQRRGGGVGTDDEVLENTGLKGKWVRIVGTGSGKIEHY